MFSFHAFSCPDVLRKVFLRKQRLPVQGFKMEPSLLEHNVPRVTGEKMGRPLSWVIILAATRSLCARQVPGDFPV